MEKNEIVTFTEADRIHAERQIEIAETEAEFEQRKKEAQEDVLSRIEDGPFNYDDIEDIMHSHGLEMDYIEDFLL